MRNPVLMLLSLLVAVTAFADEAIVNGGFESGALNPWVIDNGWVISTDNPHSGTYCAYCLDFYYMHQGFTPIPVENITSMTVWVRQPEAFKLRLWLYYGALDYDEFADYQLMDPNWTEFDLTSALRLTGSLEAIRLFGYVGGGPDPNETYVDDVSIVYESGGAAIKGVSLGGIKAVFR